MAVATALQATANSSSNASSATQAGTAAPAEPAVIDPGKPVQVEMTAGAKPAYTFELREGEYTTVSVECPRLRVSSSLFGSAGNLVDRTYGNDPSSTKDNIELVAEKQDHYRLEVQIKVAHDQGKLCTILLGQPRVASQKQVALQQARTLLAHGLELINAHKATEAIEQFRKSLELRETVLGPDDPSVVGPLSELGRVYIDKIADYPSAEAFLLRALKVQDRVDPSAADAFVLLNNLSIVYIQTDRFREAEQTLLRALKVAEKLYGPASPAAATVMVNLGNLYDTEGNYVKAQSLYEQAAANTEKEFGPEYQGLAVILSNLSGVHSERGDYREAARLAQRAVAILEKRARPEDARLGLALVALADAYRFQNSLEKAEPIYERSLKVYEKSLAPGDPLIADNLAYLAEIYSDRGDFARAETFFLRSLEIRKKTAGEDTSAVAASLHSLGKLYMAQSDYARAEPMFRQALSIQEKALGAGHPAIAETLSSISELEMATGHLTEAESSLARAIRISERNAALNLVAGSERQKLDYIQLSSSQLDRAITINTLAPDQAAARDLAITTVLQRKGRVQDLLADNLRAIRQRLDPNGVKLFDEFDEVTSHLARLVVNGPEDTRPEEYTQRVNSLRDQREHLESEISLRSAEFRAASQPVSLQAVRDALPAGSALIEFVNYRPLAGPEGREQARAGRSSETRYIAYVILPSGDAQWKELGEAQPIDRAIDAYRRALREPDSNDVTRLARDLDKRIFEPLRPLIENAGHLLISPDGQLSLMPFGALLGQDNRYAIERYSITYLSTGRDLLRMQATASSKTGPVVIADPYFGEPGTRQIASARHPDPHTPGSPDDAGLASAGVVTRRRSITAASDLSTVYFAPLEGTAQEARSIHALFPEATVFTGSKASVAVLKELNAPRILHIATHGFFLVDRRPAAPGSTRSAASPPGQSPNASLEFENPLLRSGLAFAGANISHSGNDKGILTALEASDLNLWGTKLVTLSACDTGIGEVRNREGVYGLRRSFFLAGAESLVMSLWPVSDYVTREIMTSYYNGLKRGLGRGNALRQAQLAMLKRKHHHHPFYWASFIQSGEWANLDGKR